MALTPIPLWKASTSHAKGASLGTCDAQVLRVEALLGTCDAQVLRVKLGLGLLDAVVLSSYIVALSHYAALLSCCSQIMLLSYIVLLSQYPPYIVLLSYSSHV